MNFETIPPSSFNFFSHSAFTLSVASASRPRMIASSKFLRKSFLEPRKLGFAKLSRAKYSERSFYSAKVNMTAEYCYSRDLPGWEYQRE